MYIIYDDLEIGVGAIFENLYTINHFYREGTEFYKQKVALISCDYLNQSLGEKSVSTQFWFTRASESKLTFLQDFGWDSHSWWGKSRII